VTVRIYACSLLTPILISLTVQRVYTVGGPPEGKICFFRGLKNVVVLPAVGACQRVSCMPSLTNPPSHWDALAEAIWMMVSIGYVISTWVGAVNSNDTYDCLL
jgi:hypothetical protein